jgi:hypothetical protein
MARFTLIIKPSVGAAERVELDAGDRDQALYLAEARGGDADIELWDGRTLLAEMSESTPHLWIVHSGDAASRIDAGIERTGPSGHGIAAGIG